MTKKLPTYKIVVNEGDDSGVYAVSLVDQPAIEIDWIKLSKEIVEFEFAANKDKQLLYGPLLIPGKLIFRRDDKGNEYNIVFDAETIQIIADKFNKNKLSDSFNFMHSDKTVDAYIVENWLTGTIDKSQSFGYNLPENTWFASVKVDSNDFWLKEVKTEKVKGFSVEIKAGIELVEELNKVNLSEDDKTINTNLMEIKTKDGLSLFTDGDLALNVKIYADDAMQTPIEDNDYQLEDGTVISVMNGAVAEISAAEEEAEDVAEEMQEELAVDAQVEVPAEAPAKDAIDPQAILDIVAPEMDSLKNALAEIMAKIAEMESKLAQDSTSEKMEELKAQVEKLSAMPATTSIDSKNDSKIKQNKEDKVVERLNSIKKYI
jgi:hypothetical protein